VGDESGSVHSLPVSADGQVHMCGEAFPTVEIDGPITWTQTSDVSVQLWVSVNGERRGVPIQAIGQDSDPWAVVGYWPCGVWDNDPALEYSRGH
jgi:hypothetical protein